MVAVYTLLLWLKLPINVIVVIFGSLVTALMLVIIRWSRGNLARHPALLEQIGDERRGQAL